MEQLQTETQQTFFCWKTRREHEPGKGGAVYNYRGGVCFETRFFPDAINKENFTGGIAKAGELFKSKTCYTFLVEE